MIQPRSKAIVNDPATTNGADPALAEIDALLAKMTVTPAQDQAAQEELDKLLFAAGIDDDGNAECVARLYPNRFAWADAFGWLVYVDGCWTMTNAEATLDYAVVETMRRRCIVATTGDNYKNGGEAILKFCHPNRNRVEGAKALLKYRVAAAASDFDTHKDLLNVTNGVVNLVTGELLPHDPAYRFMHRTSARYNPQADTKAWVSWVRESIENPDDEVWLQEFCGYAVTGRTREDCLLHVWGPGRSGKGTFAGAVMAALGERLAMSMSMSTLVSKHDADSQNFALAPLQPARVVVASEKEEGQRLNSAKVKTMTGGDRIRCSYKGRDHFDYLPQWKIIMLTNPPIDADPADGALWSRIHSVKFPHSHEGDEDRLLRDSWQTPAAQEAILAWMVAGAQRWYARGGAGLPRLASSIEHKQERRKELDSVAKWLDEATAAAPGNKLPRPTLYKSYTQWCESNGHSPLGNNRFGESMTRLGFEYKGLRDGAASFRGYEGIALVG